MSTKKASVDLNTQDEGVKKQNDGIEVPIFAIDGKTELGFAIRVAGPDSDQARKASDELSDELIDSENIDELNSAERTVRGLRYLAKISMGWTINPTLDGVELEFSEDNAFKIYARFAFIAAQVNKKAGKRANFLKG